MKSKELFIETMRAAYETKGYTAEQLAGITDLAEKTYELVRTETEAVQAEAIRQASALIGDMGNGKTVAETLVGLEETIRGMKSTEGKKKSFKESLRSVYEDNKTAIEATRAAGTVVLTRTAGTITTGNFDAADYLGYRDGEVDAAQLLPEVLPSNFIQTEALGAGSNPYIILEREKKEGAAAVTAEGDPKPYIDYNWKTKQVNAVTIAGIVPISNQATWDYPRLESEVRGELRDELINVWNDQIINGSGIDELEGLFAVHATEFDTTGLTVEGANLWDVLILAWKQSKKAVKGQRPNAIMMSVDKIVELDLQKDKNNQYLLPTWITNANKALKGIPIVECDYLGESEVLIGSFDKVKFNFVKPLSIEMGWINDQFRRNQYSLRAEVYGQLILKTHKNNFVKISDVDAAIADITPVVESEPVVD